MRDSSGRGERGIGHLIHRAERGLGSRIDRRTFLGASLAALAAPAAFARAAELEPGAAAPPAELETALETSPFVYISPLLSSGAESTCHAEVWFGWIDGAVVINTGVDRWKARAVRKGLDRARIWVGDHGRWKRLLGRNEAFRQAPSFDAKAELSMDEALLDRLLEIYDRKYPDEIGEWRGPMREGLREGSRVLVRYTPVSATGAGS